MGEMVLVVSGTVTDVFYLTNTAGRFTQEGSMANHQSKD